MEAALLYTWAVELGLGVLESIGITPTSRKGWADIQNRLARSFQLPPDPKSARYGKRRAGRSRPGADD
jgi:hypothetical protein